MTNHMQPLVANNISVGIINFLMNFVVNLYGIILWSDHIHMVYVNLFDYNATILVTFTMLQDGIIMNNIFLISMSNL